MDRNISLPSINSMTLVALRKESVDRNLLRKITITVDEGSLSARRAWIEISLLCRILFRR